MQQPRVDNNDQVLQRVAYKRCACSDHWLSRMWRWQVALGSPPCTKGCESSWHLRGAVCNKGYRMVFVVAQAYSLCLVYTMWFACLETGVCSCLAFAVAVRLFCNCQASSLGLLSIMPSKQVAPGAAEKAWVHVHLPCKPVESAWDVQTGQSGSSGVSFYQAFRA